MGQKLLKLPKRFAAFLKNWIFFFAENDSKKLNVFCYLVKTICPWKHGFQVLGKRLSVNQIAVFFNGYIFYSIWYLDSIFGYNTSTMGKSKRYCFGLSKGRLTSHTQLWSIMKLVTLVCDLLQNLRNDSKWLI